MTRKLFEEDAGLIEFDAQVLSCAPQGGEYAVELDATAFFPEGGGQQADHGTLGGACVRQVCTREGRILHLVDAPLDVGARVHGAIDAPRRRDQSQQHTGEHILSGILCNLYGANNVGFHIGDEDVTIDFDREFTPEELREAEARANEIVWLDTPVEAWYPDRDTLAALDYRSKIELEDAVRIVRIAGADTCACCGVHVARAGQVGMIKIISAMRYKGGTRLALRCGGRALEDYGAKNATLRELGAALSAKWQEIPQAVARMEAERDDLRRAADMLCARITGFHLQRIPESCGAYVCFETGMKAAQIKRLAMTLQECAALVAAFAAGEQGYQFVLCAKDVDVRPLCKRLSDTFQGRGGGRMDTAQGTLAQGDEKTIEAMVREYYDSIQ